MTTTTPEATRVRHPSRRRVRAMVRRNLLVQMRNPGHWFLLLVLPFVDGLLFGSIGVGIGEGDQEVELLVTGIMLFHLIWQVTLAGSFGLLEEVWSRNLMNLVATPLTEREFMRSIATVGLLRTVVSTSIIALVGLGFYAVAPSSSGWVVIPAAAILLLFGWAVTLFVIALTLQYGDSAEVFSWGTLVLLMPVSGIFYPVESLPGVLQAVSAVVPLTYVFDAVRIGLDTGTVAWREIAIGAAGTVVLLALALWFLDHQLARFRAEGWITRFT